MFELKILKRILKVFYCQMHFQLHAAIIRNDGVVIFVWVLLTLIKNFSIIHKGNKLHLQSSFVTRNNFLKSVTFIQAPFV